MTEGLSRRYSVYCRTSKSFSTQLSMNDLRTLERPTEKNENKNVSSVRTR